MKHTTETTNCLTCGRPLRSAQSIARGRGKHCAAKIRRAQADTAGFKPHQVASARELIEDAAIVQIRSTVFRAVSSDGTGTYIADPTNCTCPAGRKSVKAGACYHQLAARLLLAA